MFKLITIILIFYMCYSTYDAAPTALQELPPKKGYIPVYIRFGNTPLSEINSALAEAFNEDNEFSKGRDIKEMIMLTEDLKTIFPHKVKEELMNRNNDKSRTEEKDEEPLIPASSSESVEMQGRKIDNDNEDVTTVSTDKSKSSEESNDESVHSSFERHFIAKREAADEANKAVKKNTNDGHTLQQHSSHNHAPHNHKDGKSSEEHDSKEHSSHNHAPHDHKDGKSSEEKDNHDHSSHTHNTRRKRDDVEQVTKTNDNESKSSEEQKDHTTQKQKPHDHAPHDHKDGKSSEEHTA